MHRQMHEHMHVVDRHTDTQQKHIHMAYTGISTNAHTHMYVHIYCYLQATCTVTHKHTYIATFNNDEPIQIHTGAGTCMK